MRQKQKNTFSAEYDTDDKVIQWLKSIFEIDVLVGGDGKMTKAAVMGEAREYNIDPDTVERVFAKNSQMFATTGPEYWYPVKKTRIRIEMDPEPEPKRSKQKRAGFAFGSKPSIEPLSPNEEKRVLASARKEVRAALVE
jgi:hypothetical protein